MEAAALFAIAGLGYVVTQLTGRKTEGFQSQAQRGPDSGALANAAQGDSVKGLVQNLDQQYTTLTGATVMRSEPQPTSSQGLMTAGYKPPAMVQSPVSSPEPMEGSTPGVSLNPAGLETRPTYVDGDYVVSELTGERVKSGDFTHNNMTPFFGGRVKQNVAPEANSGILDSYAGSGINQI